jgi:hypothetical protein
LEQFPVDKLPAAAGIDAVHREREGQPDVFRRFPDPETGAVQQRAFLRPAGADAGCGKRPEKPAFGGVSAVRNTVRPGKSGLPPVPFEKRPYGNPVFQRRTGFGQAFPAYFRILPLRLQQNAAFGGTYARQQRACLRCYPEVYLLRFLRKTGVFTDGRASSFPQGQPKKSRIPAGAFKKAALRYTGGLPLLFPSVRFLRPVPAALSSGA